MDGCSWNGDEDSTPQIVSAYASVAEVQCCNGTSCIRKYPGDDQSGDQCFSGNKDDAKVTWFEAEHMCASIGMRLCNSQDELDLCCTNGCGYDKQPVWTNRVAGTTLFDVY